MAIGSWESYVSPVDWHNNGGWQSASSWTNVKNEYAVRLNEMAYKYEKSLDDIRRSVEEQKRYDRKNLSMTNPETLDPYNTEVKKKVVNKCKSCNEDEHGGSFDMIGYCENRLKKYHSNLKKIISINTKI